MSSLLFKLINALKVLHELLKLWIEGEDISIIAADFIPANELLGIAFVEDERNELEGFFNNIIITPLGAWLMHNDNPNCMLVTTTRYYQLWSIKDIEVHRPLSIDRRIYNI